MRGMLAVPPLYTSASDAHAKLGGPLDQNQHQKRKTNWLRAVNKLYRMRIASREVDAQGWRGARRSGELLGDPGVHEGGAADGKPWRGGPELRRGTRGVSQGLP